MLAPVIVLGLGGIGSEITIRLEKKVKGKKLSGKVMFATLDTDINTINKMEQAGFGGTIIQMSRNMTVKEYLNKNKGYEKWFKSTEGLNIKSMTEGAGQVRAVSRLAFDMAVRSGYLNELEEKIGHLFQISENKTYQTPRILIISSLAGGTGSGMVLPLALYMRRYFEERLHMSSVIIKGMFIMPDVFEDIIGSTYERISMEANAYAAVKELEAFIKKGEGYLAPNYSANLQLELPNVASNNWEEYVTLPYNYCYLFGKKNSAGDSLRSFQDYLDYTVECIYAQAFSPMQELNNSIEDNVFRIVCTSSLDSNIDGFKRFCGAGTAVLNYPYEKIVELLALRKATKILSEQWAVIDREYILDCQQKEEVLKKGKYVSYLEKRDFYLEYINSKKMENSFIKKIYMDTMVAYDMDSEEIGYRESWIEYWNVLEKEVDRWLSDYTFYKNYYNNVQDMLGFVEKKSYHRTSEQFRKIREFYKTLLTRVKKELDKKKGLVKFKFFGNRSDDTIDETYFVYWLKKDGKFIHPNAVRYFLYNAIEMFDKKQDELRKNIEEMELTLDGYKNSAIDKTDFYDKAFLNNLFHRDEMNNLINLTRKGLEVLKEYQCTVILEEITQKGSEIFQKIAKQYEEFYSVFDYNIEMYTEKAENLSYSIHNTEGTVTRYVCCDDVCLENMEAAIIDVRNDVEINGEISEVIFNLIWNNRNNTTNNIRDYHDIFQELLVDYWKGELKEKHNHLLDMDILEALQKECLYMIGNGRNEDTYASVRINKMWDIAGPFISVQEGNAELSKGFCAYSVLLEDKKDYVRDGIIKLLKDRGGTADVEGAIDKYTIIFYEVLYALSPGNLKEMAIGWNEKKKNFEMGSNSKSYYQMLKNTSATKLSPHINWNWNQIDILPDFNVEYQKYLEKLTYQMFLYECALSLDIIEVDDEKIYRISLNDKNEEATTLYKILVECFLMDCTQSEKTYMKMKKNIEKCILEGKAWEKQEFIGSVNNWCRCVGGIFGAIYRVNVDGGINKYDKYRMKAMVDALMELLWDIFIQFGNERKARNYIQDTVNGQLIRYREENLDTDVFITRDMEDAIKNKLRDMDILINWN